MGFFNLRRIVSRYKAIPLSIRKFLLKATGLYIGWLFVYHLYLEPRRVVDPPLTNFVAHLSCSLVGALYPTHQVTVASYSDSNTPYSNPLIKIDESCSLLILDGCNGLELFIFYIGFIICFNGPLRLSLIYIVLGAISILVLNVARCAALLCLQYNNFSYIESFHHYVFTIIVYGFIFLLWLGFLKQTLNTKNSLIK